MENLLAFMFRTVMDESLLHYTECVLGILYLYLVVKNLLWFIKPLEDRDEYTNLEIWFEDLYDAFKEHLRQIKRKIRKWIPGLSEEVEGKDTRSIPGRNTLAVTKAAMKLKAGPKKLSFNKNEDTKGNAKAESGAKNGMKPRRANVSFDFAKEE